MKKFRVLLISLLIMTGVISVSHAYDLELKVTTDGVTVPVPLRFDRGESLILVISVDNAEGVVGAAFTLEYPSTVLDGPVTDSNGLSLSNGVTSSFFHNLSTTSLHRVNAETGAITFSGAAINATGGAVNGAGPEELFFVSFTVRNDAAVGTYFFNLKQTQLWNPQAGYGKDASGNDVPTSQINMTVGDKKEAVPVLVGAKNNGDAGYDNYSTTCEGIGKDCAFPVLLGGTTNSYLGDSQSFIVASNIGTDSDGDGIADDLENINGTNPFDVDTDGDGYTDINDPNPLIQDPADTNNPFYNELLDVRVSNLDVDGDNVKSGSVDGIIILRYLYGFADNDLLTGLTVTGPRNTPALVKAYLDKVNQTVFDIDGSATANDPTASVDGILIMRFLYGFSTNDLVLGIENILSGPRTAPQDIEDYLNKIGTP